MSCERKGVKPVGRSSPVINVARHQLRMSEADQSVVVALALGAGAGAGRLQLRLDARRDLVP